MPGILKVHRSDIFEGPSDLIVIPCTTTGTLTRHAEEKLAGYGIPRPPRRLGLGSVSILPFSGAEHIAQFVAFAATAGASTPATCVEEIARAIGAETARNRIVRRVAAPLVGVGAGERPGQLTVALDAVRRGFLATAAAHAVFVLHIVDERMFNDASLWFVGRSQAAVGGAGVADRLITAGTAPVRVFISYTKSSDEHAKWVEGLATMLRTNGVDARLDVWHLRPGMDVAQFMCNEIALADRVLVVSNDEYARRADGRLGGVGWETQLICGDLLTKTADDPKYLVIARTGDLRTGVPMFLKSKLVIQWADNSVDEANRELLLRELYGRTPIEPRLGTPPLFG
jgi:TIR domain